VYMRDRQAGTLTWVSQPPVGGFPTPNQNQGAFLPSVSGDGRYAYVSTGDVISPATKRIAGALEDGSGVKVSSENFLEVEIADGHPNR